MVILQRAWRRVRANRRQQQILAQEAIRKTEKAVVTIQAAFRGYRTRSKYRAMKNNAIKLQRFWRSFIVSKQQRDAYLELKKACIVIQSHYRRRKVQQQLLMMNKSATCLQSCYRMYSARNRYLLIRRSVIRVQVRWRAILAGRKERKSYLKLQHVAIMIQSHFRRWRVQQNIARQNKSAIVIQAALRCHQQRKRYIALKSSTIVLQKHWNATLKAKSERRAYLQQREATITIQSYIRRWQVQRMIAQQHKAATIIQAAVRRRIEMKRYSITKHSVCVLQCHWRATILGRRQKEVYMRKKQAAIIIQANVRRWQVQRMMAQQHKAATTIQSMVRCHLHRQRYIALKKSTLVIQYRWRATLLAIRERMAYLQLKRASIVLQSHVRRWRIQREISRQHKAATLIQSMYRCYIQRKQYIALKYSTNVLQCYWRASLLAKKDRMEFLCIKQATITIQSHVRRWQVEKMMAQQHRAATIIQAAVRCRIEMKRYSIIKHSVCVLQCYWRATILCRKEREAYIRKKQAAIIIQANVRRWRVEKMMAQQHRAAAVIQSAVRCHIHRRHYLALKQSATTLQYRWRATLSARRQQQSYIHLRQAVIVLQSHFRRWQVEKEIANQHKSAIVIQAAVRCHIQRKRYQNLRYNSIAMQYRWRASQLAKQQRNNYLKMKWAAVLLQACVRRWQVQKMLATKHEAATVIQATMKCFVQRKRFLALKNAVMLLQYRWRATLLACKERKAFINMKQATIIIQSHIRKWQVQRMMAQQHRAATIIQAAVRCRIEMKRYSIMKHSVCVLQCHWRATILCRKEREAYIRKKQAAIIIQANVRRWQVQRMMAQQHKAATTIQSTVRCHLHRQRYIALKKSTLVIQYHWRATLLAKRERMAYLQLKGASIVLQSHVRRWRVQREISRQQKAATLIQSMYRCYIQRKQYIALKYSTNVLQCYWRASLLAKKDRMEFLCIKQATITIQSHVRRWQVEKMMAQQHKAATIIQAAVRCRIEMKRYSIMKHSVCILQCYWRATMLCRREREAYIRKKQAAIIIQANVRRWQVQRMIVQQHRAATTIQSAARCHIHRRHYLALKRSATTLQYRWRATLSARRQQQSYIHLRQAVIVLQSHFRRWQVEKEIANQHKSATIIQATVRCHIKRKQYLALKYIVTVLQDYWRATLMAKRERETYLQLKNATIIIQSHFRRYKVMRMIAQQKKAACIIQAAIRCHIQRKNYLALKQSASLLQYYWRATLLARKQKEVYVELRQSTIVIQANFRRWQVQRMISQQHKAATTIQSAVRCHIHRRHYLALKQSATTLQYHWRATISARRQQQSYIHLRQAVIVLQSHFRRWQVEKEIANQHKSATIIQATVRCHIKRKQYLALKHIVTVLQDYWRATLMARRERETYLQLKNATIIIQSHFRRYKAMRMIAQQKKAACIIQAAVRCHIQRKNYLALKQSASLLQYYWRATLLARKQKEVYVELRQSTIVIQANFRRWQVQRMISQQHRAATTIQSAVRCHIHRRHYLALKQSATTLQCHWRATISARRQQQSYIQIRQAVIVLQSHFQRWQVEKEIANQHKSAIVIQAAVRCHIQRKRYQNLRYSAIAMQYRWRASQLAKQQRNNYLRMKWAAVLLQACVRRWQVQKMLATKHEAATVIQATMKCFVQRKRFLALKNAVMLLQYRWRATLLAWKERKAFINMKQATIIIQSHIRRWQVLRMIAQQHRAATIIQAAVRCRIEMKRYSIMKHSVCILQCYWRATMLCRREREAYIRKKQAAIIIQANVRRWQVQRMMAQQHRAATTIQSTVRCHLHRQRYIALKKSTLVIQYRWRATLLATRERMAYLQLKRASIVLQSHVRRWRIQREISRQQKAATIIQSMYRCYIQRKQYIALKYSTNVLQCYWRASLLAKKDRMEFLCIKQATITIQSHVRRWQVEKMMAQQHRAATIIQAAVRRRIEMKRYSIMKHSVCILQCYWRATMLCRKEREAYIRKKQAAIIIQANVRRWQVQRMIAQQHRAATIIQAAVRCRIEMKRYSIIKHSICVLQCYWRATILCRREREAYICKKQAAIIIQANIRRRRVEKMMAQQHRAATVIQSAVRCHIHRRHYLALKQSATTLQCRWRATLSARKQQQSYIHLRQAVIVLQSHFRRWQVEKEIANQHKSATIIQATVRCHIKRKQYLALKHIVTVLQDYWRATLMAKRERETYLQLKNATIIIQSHFRRYKAMRMIAQQKKAACIIQAAVRCHIQRKAYLEKKRAVIVIQSYFRKYQEVNKITCNNTFLIFTKSHLKIYEYTGGVEPFPL